ncbi:2',3'-cyclic-nucleotide 2'-phosphodiesterase (5'-nucleotidase family) [Wenyingzhuangia heitensis]|uniref:2',3'-cyclic-nucleotide 2'-phosphodiesterase (5'-nucleotidase family) n=1 Tax=Wenyingzhuangia heitensis TaxID=1487859 RepID=A0ABX0U7G4_9FLAO|nr:bifunctional metallophosphatase/5'-nucleotidase [Wenyingzhuangia heitensis]NIJ44774.1 2',3'-cyclic-nucleotide 2'-phosphodiesterase (5'-nucleotidase family) [Wenyingzhuangia heitensis]
MKKLICAIAVAFALYSCDEEIKEVEKIVEVDASVQAKLENSAFVLQLLHYADVDGDEEIALNSINQFATMIKHFQNDVLFSENTLTVNSGDIIIPGPRYNTAEESVIRAMTGSDEPGHIDIAFANAFGVDAAVIGNHELDQGPGELADAISSESKNDVTFSGSNFPYLATNIDFSGESDFTVGTDGAETNTLGTQVAKYAVKTIKGEKIGIVGAASPTFPKITSVGNLVFSPGVEFTNEQLAAEIQTSVNTLKGMGINKIVLLAHMQQISVEKALAELLTDVDIIVAGGSNTRMGDENDILFQTDTAFDEEYPYTATNPNDEPVLVVNVDGDYKYLGRLIVGFDENGVIDTETLSTIYNGVYPSNNNGVSDLEDAVSDLIDEQFSNVIGYSNVFLDGRREQVRTEETNLGNMSADANLWYANLLSPEPVDISIKNGGGIRAAMGQIVVAPDGTTTLLPSADKTISEGHLRAAFKFDNGLVRLTVTAAELKDLLEHGFAASANGATPGQFPQVAGMVVEYDTSKTARTTKGTGNRVQKLSIGQDLVVDGGNIQGSSTRTFNLVTLNFLANGGDLYPFSELSAPNRINFYEGAGFGEDTAYPGAILTNDPNNNSAFSYTGGEQDAIAEYMLELHASAETAYDVEETTIDNDTRIIKLN